MREGINICQYFEHFESELRDAKIPKNSWNRILVSKLSLKAEKKCAHLIHNHDATYKILKNHLMKHIGPSSEELCNIVHGAAYSEFKDKKETEKLQHAKYIVERYFQNIDLADDTVIDHMVIRLYKFHCDRRFAHSLKRSKYHSLEDVLELTASFNSQTDYDKSKADKSHYPYRKPYPNKIVCEYWKKGGHTEAECYRKQNESKRDNPRSDKQPYKPRHQDNKRSFNPSTKEQYKDAGVKTRPVTVNWNQTTAVTNSIKGQVNGHDADIIIDTGAQITVVPGKFVYHDDLTGDTVSILGVNSNPMPYQTARIPITLRNKTVYDTVAVAPADQLNTKVLLSTPVNNITVDYLVDSYLSKEHKTDEDTREPVSVDQAIQINKVTRPTRVAKTPHNYFPEEEQSDTERHEDDRARQREPVQTCAPMSNQSEPPPLSTLSEPSPPSAQIETSPHTNKSEPPNLENTSEPPSPETHTPLVEDQPTAQRDCVPFNIPTFPVIDKASNSDPFKAATKSDPTLKVLRGLAYHDRNGYAWDKGLLYHVSSDPPTGDRKCLVVPKPYRANLMKIAHDNSGHFSNNKTRIILNHRFTWPNMGADVAAHISACIQCKKFNKTAHKQAPFYNRPTISEPYEEIALDLIGPLPRSKHGYRFALTAICMASRWPEVYPLANSDAECVATALIQFLARNGIPVKILMDQGTQFMSNVITQTCAMLSISHITTVPYRPQGNGVLERFHGTLKPLLAKASDDGIDWVSFLPLALSAIRSVPCRSSGFSPAELVFGKNPRNFLDVLFEEWSNPSYSSVDVTSWVQQLQDKLELLRDTATLNNHLARSKQNTHKAKSRSHRKYKPGDLVFTRIPGCRAVLQVSWEGPFVIQKFLPPLNYEVSDPDHTWTKITHVNNLRNYKPLPQPKPNPVNVACLVAEEPSELSNVLQPKPLPSIVPCSDLSQATLDTVLDEYKDVFSVTLGDSVVNPFNIRLAEDATTSSRPPYQVPIHLRTEGNKELDKLLLLGIIEPSDATEWCAPIVPVRKPDNSLRLCIDYREINKVTPLDRHIIPTLPQILDRIGHVSVLSKVDLTSGFHQIVIHPDSRDYTTFLSPKGKYRFVRMPFGLKNSPSHFQRIMEKTLAPVADCAAVYIDDVIIFSTSWQEHLDHLTRVFECFRQAGLTAEESKCAFGKAHVT